MNGVYSWLRDNGCWMRRTPVADPSRVVHAPTHLMLDGGRAEVTDEKHAAFLNAYATSVVRDGPASASIAEQRTPVFKLFLDIDARWNAKPPDDILEAPGVGDVLLAASAAVCHAFPEVSRAAAVAAAVTASSTASATGEVWKRGLHVVWADVHVTPETALAFRKELLIALADADVASAFAAPMDDIIDACVFKSNGLRMPWSGKGKSDQTYYAPVARLVKDG